MEAIQEHIQEAGHQLVDVATNPLSSIFSILLTSLLFVWDNAPKIGAVLMVMILVCQLIAWGYKFYQWLRS